MPEVIEKLKYHVHFYVRKTIGSVLSYPRIKTFSILIKCVVL